MAYTPEQFASTYGKAAIEAAEGTTIFPLTILSAAALESGYNGSYLSSAHNNFFGVKKSSDWQGQTVTLPTNEVVNGKTIKVNAAFKSYATPLDSFKDYVKTLHKARYVNAGVLGAVTPEMQIQSVKDGGYATDPNYVSKVVGIMARIEQFMPVLKTETQKKNS